MTVFIMIYDSHSPDLFTNFPRGRNMINEQKYIAKSYDIVPLLKQMWMGILVARYTVDGDVDFSRKTLNGKRFDIDDTIRMAYLDMKRQIDNKLQFGELAAVAMTMVSSSDYNIAKIAANGLQYPMPQTSESNLVAVPIAITNKTKSNNPKRMLITPYTGWYPVARYFEMHPAKRMLMQTPHRLKDAQLAANGIDIDMQTPEQDYFHVARQLNLGMLYAAAENYYNTEK